VSQKLSLLVIAAWRRVLCMIPGSQAKNWLTPFISPPTGQVRTKTHVYAFPVNLEGEVVLKLHLSAVHERATQIVFIASALWGTTFKAPCGAAVDLWLRKAYRAIRMFLFIFLP